jgi:predicted enzyme related to lactoylglutathione lyase
MVGGVTGIPAIDWRIMNWELQVVAIPASDVDRAKEFYVEKLRFNADRSGTGMQPRD